jgi:hypothetical protein
MSGTAEGVHAPRVLERARLRLLQPPERPHRRVVEEDVDGTELFPHSLKDCGNLVGSRDVPRNRDGSAAGGRDLLGDGVENVRLPRDERDRIGAREAPGERRAQAGTHADDYRDSFLWHRSLRF